MIEVRQVNKGGDHEISGNDQMPRRLVAPLEDKRDAPRNKLRVMLTVKNGTTEVTARRAKCVDRDSLLQIRRRRESQVDNASRIGPSRFSKRVI
ncbi:hypothetical protein [Stappia stellulata]|uniref:hypothetical protein n=1 Tax=Stappia stellulata TaxID=71235 RepID=UPI0012EBA10A|nr:hypothetical protein [Stappia stellulata]